MSTNRIGGDYNADALEAFRAAYASQMQTPEDLDVAPNGLPGNEVSNTSPWIAHTGLWKYPSGKGPDDDLQKPFTPDAYISLEAEAEAEEGDMTDEEFDNYLDSLSLEELQFLAGDLGIDLEDSEDEEVMSDEEVESLIAEINNDQG
jgi:hypothetical protein